MANLYGTQLASVYEEIYQGFIDYEAEYEFYKLICKKFDASHILELGCGTGNLSALFTRDFETYTGLDYSKAMLNIAKRKFPDGDFLNGDMRDLRLKEPYNAVLITGRSTSYLLNNSDLERTFASVSDTLAPKGIFVFDTINAVHFMPFIAKNEQISHFSSYNNKKFVRESRWKKHESDQYELVAWNAAYFKITENEKQFLGKDTSIFRTFHQKEITAVLEKYEFEILDIIDRKTYAFDTQVFSCRRQKS